MESLIGGPKFAGAPVSVKPLGRIVSVYSSRVLNWRALISNSKP